MKVMIPHFKPKLIMGYHKLDTDYFTFLEYDDELSKIWISNGVNYIKHYPEVGVFLPIIFEWSFFFI